MIQLDSGDDRTVLLKWYKKGLAATRLFIEVILVFPTYTINAGVTDLLNEVQ